MVQAQIRIHAFEFHILPLDLFELPQELCIHALIPFLPIVKGGPVDF